MRAPTWVETWRIRWREFLEGPLPWILALVMTAACFCLAVRAGNIRRREEMDLQVRQAVALERLVEILEVRK